MLKEKSNVTNQFARAIAHAIIRSIPLRISRRISFGESRIKNPRRQKRKK
jgi:hypothetical protein